MATIDAEFEDEIRGPGITIWLVSATLVIFLIWAAFAWVDEIVRADGEVVSSSRPQIVQNLEGGILAELLVGEGDEVAPGDVLARLQGTQFRTAVDDLQDQIDALEIRRMRLEAEGEGQLDFSVPEALAARVPDIVASERALLEARQSDYISRREGAQAMLTEARREREVMEDLYNREIVALIELTRARQAEGDAEIRANEIETRTELDRAAEYSETLQQLASLKQSQRVAQDQLARTVVTSPMRGIVNSMNVTTIGGVIRPGEEMFQIIPLGDELYVEARVAPRDIANVAVGQSATIKLSAYDYTVYGSLSGEVTLVSADTFEDERDQGAEPHYRVTVSVDADALTARQRNIQIRPGLQGQVELQTGEHTVLQYLLRPLYKSREAFREPS